MPDRLKAPDQDKAAPWTQRELDLLHEMVRDFDRAQWLRGQIKWWVVWILGIPAFVLTIWEPLVRLWKLVRGV